MSEKRKLISIPSNNYKLVYGLSYGSISKPYYETLENIRFLLIDNVTVVEHIGDKTVELTMENYDKDNGVPTPPPVVVVDTVTLALSVSTIDIAGTSNVTATVKPDNAADKAVTYTSENEAIATVAANGTVTGVAEGTTAIIGRTSNGVEGRVNITVNPATPTRSKK